MSEQDQSKRTFLDFAEDFTLSEIEKAWDRFEPADSNGLPYPLRARWSADEEARKFYVDCWMAVAQGASFDSHAKLLKRMGLNERPYEELLRRLLEVGQKLRNLVTKFEREDPSQKERRDQEDRDAFVRTGREDQRSSESATGIVTLMKVLTPVRARLNWPTVDEWRPVS